MSLAVDEYGNPFLVLREQAQRRRLRGLEAQRANILAARAVANTLRTSLGPKGMDKMIVSPDGDVTSTNDGATILAKMEVEHQVAKLLVALSSSQDDEIGDGTTGVVVLAGALLDQALLLLEKGVNPLRVGESFELACEIAARRVTEMAKSVEPDRNALRTAAATALGSKVVSAQKDRLADLAVSAVLSVADLDRKDANFDLIKVEIGRGGGRLEDSQLVRGIVLEKEMSHPQMEKEVRDAKIAILTCPFEPPKPKTKHRLDVTDAAGYKALQAAEAECFRSMVQRVKDSGANFVACQWGFDDEANHLLLKHGLPSVRWVGGVELELLAIATGGKIVARFEDLTPDCLGRAETVREVSAGTQNAQTIFVEGCANSKTVTVILRGGNKFVAEEARRCFHDAICCVRNLVRDNRVVPGGGAPEIAAAVAVEAAADSLPSVHQYGARAFAEALMAIPEALADNAGLDALRVTADIRAKHAAGEDGAAAVGVDVNNDEGMGDMFAAGVWESLASKVNQLQLATQVVRMILKIDDVIAPADAIDY